MIPCDSGFSTFGISYGSVLSVERKKHPATEKPSSQAEPTEAVPPCRTAIVEIRADQFLQDNEMALKDELRAVFVLYLSQLYFYLDKYFPEDEVEPIKWVRDPFNPQIPQYFNNEEAEQLIDVSGSDKKSE
ncbi:uncharacterized protein LOC144819240 isoform X2 [Lissotriton helveticus]